MKKPALYFSLFSLILISRATLADIKSDLDRLNKYALVAAQNIHGDLNSLDNNLAAFDSLNTSILNSYGSQKGDALLLLEPSQQVPWALFQSSYALALSRAMYAASADIVARQDDRIQAANEYGNELAGVLQSFDNLFQQGDGVSSTSYQNCAPEGLVATECFTFFSRGLNVTGNKTWYRNPPNQLFAALRNLFLVQAQFKEMSEVSDENGQGLYWPQNALGNMGDQRQRIGNWERGVMNYMAFAPLWSKTRPTKPPRLSAYLEFRSKAPFYAWAFYEFDLSTGQGWQGDLVQNCYYHIQDVVQIAGLFNYFDADPDYGQDAQIQQAENYLKRFSSGGKRFVAGSSKYPFFLYQAFYSATSPTIAYRYHGCEANVKGFALSLDDSEGGTLDYLNSIFEWIVPV